MIEKCNFCDGIGLVQTIAGNFDEEDLDSLGYTDDELDKKIDQILWKINN